MGIHEYDVIVIGSGPAGEKGAVTAGLLGKRVALVERERFVGGASANTGTLPSKTLRETALALSGFRARDLYGVDLSLRREANIRDFMYHESKVKEGERVRIRESFHHRNVSLHQGFATFEDPHTVRVETSAGEHHRLRADKILIATGSAPLHPPGFPFEDPRVHDSDEILNLSRLPKTLAVVGAGVIGSEYACTFAALGVKVFVIDGRDVLLPFLDRELSRALEHAMEHQLNIRFHWLERVNECTPAGELTVRLRCVSGFELEVEGVLVAAGRTGNTATLNLPAAGLGANPKGLLTVDQYFRTSVPHIYAAGDVIGFPALAATSAEQGRIAMSHAFDSSYKQEVAPLLPSGIYTIPEVSSVGETEEALRLRGTDYLVGRAYYAANPRGAIMGDRSGFLKLLFDSHDKRLLGVHVIGEHATEIVHIGLMAMLTKSGAPLFLEACFNYPTLGDLYKYATLDAILESGPSGVAL